MRWLPVALIAVSAYSQPARPRARDIGIAPGTLTPGPLNGITDVAGVRVGHITIIEGDTVRTGVTAILPHGGNLFQDKVTGAVFVGNAFGKLAGSTQVQELGTIETPIVLTNTLSVGTAIDAVVRWTLARPGNESVRSVNAIVGETNDGGLNDIRGVHVTREHVIAAIAAAKTGPVDEGAVGAGTGTIAFGWKGGIGSSSRTVRQGNDTWTVGVLVQSNYGGKLVIDGAPIWKALRPGRAAAAEADLSAEASPRRADLSAEASARRADLSAEASARRADLSAEASARRADLSAEASARRADLSAEASAKADGSCMIVVATDAPLDARNLQRLAARAVFALARTGSTYSNGSGDFAIAFTTHQTLRATGAAGPQTRSWLPTDEVSGLFEAVLDATEEAIDNSLLKATDVTANGRTIRAIPIDALRALLKTYGR
jgi:D-aminopeptidase